MPGSAGKISLMVGYGLRTLWKDLAIDPESTRSGPKMASWKEIKQNVLAFLGKY
jgi:hypothetical protein